MEYRAVGNRCAVDLDALNLPIPRPDILSILARKGFVTVDVDIIHLARMCIGTSRYRRGARLSEAPAFVDCSCFVKWLYACRGVWLPRRSIQQFRLGTSIRLEDVRGGDLIFTSGWRNYYDDDPSNGVGHVGIATEDRTVVHAAGRTSGVVETPLETFVGKRKFRGARRHIPHGSDVLTLEAPAGRDVETSDDIRWIVLQSLSSSS